jgi:hypothetical protein
MHGAKLVPMEIGRYVDSIRQQFEATAEAAGDEARALAERLVAPLESAIRLALQDALTDAAEEITLELAPGSVEVRLRGRDVAFVVSLPPADPSVPPASADEASPAEWRPGTDQGGTTQGDDDSVARINLRLPQWLKDRVERAAAAEGLSINTWLVRATASAVERSAAVRGPGWRSAVGPQRYRGWTR